MTTTDETAPEAPEEYGICVIAANGGFPRVTRADAKARFSDQIVSGANSMHTPWLTLDGNLLTLVDVTYLLVGWDGYCHIGVKVAPPRQRRRTPTQ